MRIGVRPWEPVSGGYFEEGQWPILPGNPSHSFYGFYPSSKLPVYLTLANGQRIVARPLSEERKAARRMGRKAVVISRDGRPRIGNGVGR